MVLCLITSHNKKHCVIDANLSKILEDTGIEYQLETIVDRTDCTAVHWSHKTRHTSSTQLIVYNLYLYIVKFYVVDCFTLLT